MVSLFEQANTQFINSDCSLIWSNVNERTLCGALMLHLHDLIKEQPEYDGYFTDVEYNRNKGQIKTIMKTIMGPREEIIRINCDLILHSRGLHPEQDNLIAIEMKKSNRPREEKEKDCNRLLALTKDSFDDIWSFDGHTLPEHVCRYILGVYYEINIRNQKIIIRYFQQGEERENYCIPIQPMK